MNMSLHVVQTTHWFVFTIGISPDQNQDSAGSTVLFLSTPVITNKYPCGYDTGRGSSALRNEQCPENILEKLTDSKECDNLHPSFF